MTTIAPGQRLDTGLRTGLAGTRERASAPASTAPSTAASPTRSEAAQRQPHTLSASLVRRIAAIAPDDPERPRKAVRLYLEGELAREFGAGLLNDPDFPALLDAVQQRMQEDAQTAGAVEALGRLLLAGRPAPQKRSLGPR